MKGILLCAFVALLGLAVFWGSAFAQSFPTNTGSVMLTGAFQFTNAGGDLYEDGDGDRATMISFNPVVNVFATPGFSLGGGLTFAYASQGDYSQTTWGIGPRMAYFIGGHKPRASAKGTVYPYLGTAFQYIHSAVDYGWGDFSASGTMIYFGFGFMNMITNTVGLFGEGGYQIDSQKPEDGDSESGTKINIVLGLASFLY